MTTARAGQQIPDLIVNPVGQAHVNVATPAM